ncbi:Hint domain-containing protein [Gluconobacter sp. Gdi]|uniref:Hint domain-containing protein n=1 Tax=Gluconobacter sp. Gdi TaxID=2691888 RepID=UPI0017610F91|nr:Hint domain-containing protein [Gluconobacter sp. Gdi]GFE95175.1 hypothetical protein DmGdi_02480 [Gluconobacter sp. Gdi]
MNHRTPSRYPDPCHNGLTRRQHNTTVSGLYISGKNDYLVVQSGGTAIDTTVTAGGHLQVYSGGKTISSILTVPDTEEVIYSGGTATGTIATRGAGQTVNKGGVASSTVASNGNQFIFGGSSFNASIQSGGKQTLTSGTATANTVTSGGTVVATGGTTVRDRILAGGVENISQNAVASGATVSGAAARLNVSSGGSAVNTIVNAGGNIVVGNKGTASGTIVSSGGSLVIQGGSITGTMLVPGGQIDVSTLDYQGNTAAKIVGNVLTVTQGKASYTIKLVGDYSKYHAHFSPDRNGKTVISLDKGAEVCFLADTMIRTTTGDMPVQDIQIGAKVLAWTPEGEQARPVVWVGRKHAIVRQGLAPDVAGYPVRICKNAIADGVPSKDLLVTPEHSLFIDGGLIPARMLVNGRSIIYDTSITSYDYFHIETDVHSVLTSDGMLTESYLNTGNRDGFTQDNAVVSLSSPVRTWEADAAAPLTVSRDKVEPIHHALAQRAMDLGLADVRDVRMIVTDPDLHLITPAGKMIRQSRESNGRAIFMLPSNVGSVRLVSRTAKPSDAIGPYVDDRRDLGVLVGDITLYASESTRRITSHLEASELPGWADKDNSAIRWTLGDAELDLGSSPVPHGMSLLAVEIVAGGPYIDQQTTEVSVLQA